jgi:tight adherence protein B
MIVTLVFLTFLFITYIVYLIAASSSEARQLCLEQRVKEALEDAAVFESAELLLTRQSASTIPWLDRLLSPMRFTRKLDRALRQADIQISVSRLMLFCMFAAVMAVLAGLTLFSSPLLILVMGGVAAAVPVVHVNWVGKRRLAKFLEQLPDTLDLMSRSLAVGHAFPEALYQVSNDMPEPIATEFRITYEEQKLGLSTKLALEHLAERVPLLDLRLCITAMMIQRETGGNLAEILEKVATTIRERFKLMEEFRTMTTASRGSAWILCALPFFIVFAIMAMNPNYMNPLLHDPRGHYILGAAAVMQILGVLSIRRILAIKI